MKAVRSHIKEDWILLYIERWLTAPLETTEGTQVPWERGTPQGGVSPILMNLFMHYAFDVWMKRTNPSCPFARYADDAVVHCGSREQAVYREIYARFCEGFRVQLPGPTRHRDGFAVWAKRLEEGTYAMPFGDTGEKRREITAAELGALLSGIDLSRAKPETVPKKHRRSRINIGCFSHSSWR